VIFDFTLSVVLLLLYLKLKAAVNPRNLCVRSVAM